METYRKVYCKDRMPDRSDDLTNLSVTVPAAWEFPAGEGTQIISSFYDFLHNEWVVNITEFHHPCKFAGYWLESVPTPEPPAAGPTIQGKGEWEKTFESYIEWQKETFPNQTVIGKLNHLKGEVDELIEAIEAEDVDNIQEEFADCFMLLYSSLDGCGWGESDMHKAFKKKFEIIKKRKNWKPNPDGSFQHVDESKGDEVKGVTVDEATIAHNITTRILNEHRKHSKTLKKDEWAKIAGNKLVADLQHSGLLQPTPGQGEWIDPEVKLPRNGQEIQMFRDDAGVFSGFYGNIAENLPDSEVESLYNEGMSEESIWEVCFWSYQFSGIDRLEDDLIPQLWRPLPQPLANKKGE